MRPPAREVEGSVRGAAHAAAGRPHAIVIGSGFGGLAAAVRLGAKGYRVTVLEKGNGPGGRARVFRQDGFSFDAGPTIITVPHVLEELWTAAGRDFHAEIDLRELDPFYRIRLDDGRTFDASRDPDRMRAEIARFSPEDVVGYDRYLKVSKEICDFAFVRLGHEAMHSASFMASIIPRLLKHGGARTLHAMVSRYIKSPELRAFMSFHPLLIGGNPFDVTAIYALISDLEQRWGVHFAMGGTDALVTGLVSVIEGQGSRLVYNAEVDEILLDGRRAVGVRFADGDTMKADIVVSNADAPFTYKHLLRNARKRWWPDWRVDRSRYSMGLFVWYFGTKRRYDDVPHHMILLGPRYEQLLRDIFHRKHLADDFSLYLHRPTATDPSLAPPGCDTFYVLSPVPHLDGSTDWAATEESYRQRIEAYLARTVLPDLGQEIVSSKTVTPLYFRDDLNSLKGAGFSLEPLITQSAWFRPHNRAQDVERLYLVGAGTHPGAGVPGVISSAKVLDKVVPDAINLSR
jgi:phytoene desaturase